MDSYETGLTSRPQRPHTAAHKQTITGKKNRNKKKNKKKKRKNKKKRRTTTTKKPAVAAGGLTFSKSCKARPLSLQQHAIFKPNTLLKMLAIFPVPSRDVTKTNSPWPGIIKLFLAWGWENR